MWEFPIWGPREIRYVESMGIYLEISTLYMKGVVCCLVDYISGCPVGYSIHKRKRCLFLAAEVNIPMTLHLLWISSLCLRPCSVQFSSVTQSCLTLCDPMNRSTPGLPVHHQHPEFTQTHVHQVGDAIQPSHPLSSPSPPAPNPSQHQSLFQWVNSSQEVAKVLEFQL